VKINALSKSAASVRLAGTVAVSILSVSITWPLTAMAQDAALGKQVFVQCAACHATSDSNGIGPGLKEIDGRKVGSVDGFRYSGAMKATSHTWDAKSLDAFLTSPSKAIPGNAMPFAGLADPKQRADLIAYLSTLK
jgi:cytochrome c